MNTAEPLPIDFIQSNSLAAIRKACLRIPPLFDLDNFVAVNPFLGWSDTPLVDASNEIFAGLGSDLLPHFKHYEALWDRGEIKPDDLALTAKRLGIETEGFIAQFLASLGQELPGADNLEEDGQIDHSRMVQRFISRNLAELFGSLGNTGGRITADQIFTELIQRACLDKTFGLMGVTSWREKIRMTPLNYLNAVEWIESLNPVSTEYVYRLLGAQYGWASFLRGYEWKSETGGTELLEALCAALMVFDRAIHESGLNGKVSRASQEDVPARLCLQEAHEDNLLKSQLREFLDKDPHVPVERPDFQVMFCIDVRSEVIRRKLESVSRKVETVGFAGFFGISVDFVKDDVSTDRCPVLLKPNITFRTHNTEYSQALPGTLRASLISPGSFSLVETIGIGYLGSLWSRATGWWSRTLEDEGTSVTNTYAENHFGLTLAERVQIAESILINSGIGSRLGRLVAICGHGGHSTNNAHAASLDCGACGGHCGELNARMAVDVLNDPGVRNCLMERGFTELADTFFVAGMHNTSTDEVALYEPHDISADHVKMVKELRGILALASSMSREERAMTTPGKNDDRALLDSLKRRANDWSEVRPEWGLARNSSFIAARRFRTREANFDGRTFLHDYDASLDAEDSILKLVLSAPVVVASWINLQYFASTVDNERFGCGTKALLNRVGNIGVVSGNEGDLRPGLPLESVQLPDGSWFHDPVRLQVVIEAPREKIDRVLMQIPDVENLVKNGWIRLFALEPNESTVSLKRMDGEWERFDEN